MALAAAHMRHDDDSQPCPVCRGAQVQIYMDIERSRYWRCSECRAIFLDPAALPDREAEYAHYLKHDNRIDDPGYRNFLNRLVEPLLKRLAPGLSGLDYGCGPGPALAVMLEEAGHRMALYDPFFRPDPAPLAETYDFVTCTETVEHFHDPAREFVRLAGLVRPGGWLAVMTRFPVGDAAFPNWRYRRDPTHVVFYGEETLRHVARAHGFHCEVPREDVALMRKTVLQ